MAGAGAAEEGNDLPELGDGCISHCPAVRLDVGRGFGCQLGGGGGGGVKDGVALPLGGEELDQLANALEAGCGLLDGGLFNLCREGLGSVAAQHELHGHEVGRAKQRPSEGK